MRHGDDEERCEKRRNAAPSHCKQAAEKDDVVGELIGWNRTSRRDAEARVDFDLAIVSDEMRSAQPLIERQQPLGGESEETVVEERRRPPDKKGQGGAAQKPKRGQQRAGSRRRKKSRQ